MEKFICEPCKLAKRKKASYPSFLEQEKTLSFFSLLIVDGDEAIFGTIGFMGRVLSQKRYSKVTQYNSQYNHR